MGLVIGLKVDYSAVLSLKIRYCLIQSPFLESAESKSKINPCTSHQYDDYASSHTISSILQNLVAELSPFFHMTTLVRQLAEGQGVPEMERAE